MLPKLDPKTNTAPAGIKAGFRLYTQLIFKVLPLSLLAAVLSQLPIFHAVLKSAGDVEKLSKLVPTNSFEWVLLIASPMLSIFCLTILLAWIDHLYQNKSCSFKVSYALSINRYWPVLGVSVAFGLLVGLGLMLFVVPGLMVGVLFSLALPYVLFDQQAIFQALKLSYQTVSKSWSIVFCVLAPPVIIVFAVNILMNQQEGHDLLLNKVLINTLLKGVIYPWGYANLVVVYRWFMPKVALKGEV